MTDALPEVRVIDLARVWAGPHCGRLLADLGAEVIHVTGRRLVGATKISPETARILGVFPDNEPGERPWNRNSQALDLARNKLDITLELDTAEGIGLLKRLIAISDVLLENYSPRVMPKFGLDYSAVRAINPRIIMCSMPGYGSEGPYRDYLSYGTNVDPASGLASMMGYPDGPPHIGGNAYPDPVAALHASGAIMAALYARHRTGEGCHIDMSQAEATTGLLGEAILGVQLNGKVPAREGNRHPAKAPHGAYPCCGEDRWIAIAVGTAAEWAGLCRVIGRPSWLSDERYADADSRWRHREALDADLAAWTRGEDAHALMHALQEAGVPAGAVLDARELSQDAHLNARGFFWEIDHPEAGLHRYAGQPIRLSDTPARLHRRAPCMGEHNAQVLGQLLGLGPDEIEALEDRGVIGQEALPPK